MRLAPDLLAEIVEHARRDAPNECCGLVGMREGRAVSVHAAANQAASPFRFEIGGHDLLTVYELEDAGTAPGAIYHSHTRSEPYPSQTDINFAKGWPDWLWLIVGLADGEPQVRCYDISGGEVSEVEVTVEEQAA